MHVVLRSGTKCLRADSYRFWRIFRVVVRLLPAKVSEKKEGTLATNTFRGLHGAFIVADIARQETFHGVAKFRQIIDEKVPERAANTKIFWRTCTMTYASFYI